MASYGSSTLPSGPDVQNYTLTTIAQIFDKYLANSSAYFPVQVLVSEAATNALPDSVPLKLSAGTGSVDETIQVLSTVSAVLNAVPCKQAPNCTALLRSLCATTPNTCGPCLLPSYVGDNGDSNTACTPASNAPVVQSLLSIKYAANAIRNMTCKASSECPMWYSCAGGQCVSSSKPCLRGCSGSGNCTYVNTNTGIVLAGCALSDSTCAAVCACRREFGGADCSLTASALAVRQKIRLTLISAFYNVTKIQNVNSLTVVSWLSSLNSLMQKMDEVPLSAVPMLNKLAGITLSSARTLRLDYSLVEPVLTVIDSIATKSWTVQVTDSYSRRLQQFAGSQSSVNAELSLITSFAKLTLSKMIKGQSDVAYIMNNFRMVSSYQALGGNNSVQIISPLNAGDVYSQAMPVLVQVRAPTRYRSASVSAAVIVVSMINYGQTDAASFQSNPFTLILNPCVGCAAISQVNVTMTVPNLAAEYYPSTIPQTHSKTCRKDHQESTAYSCPSQLPNVTALCDGSFVGVQVVSCPYIVTSPVCSLLKNHSVPLFSGSTTTSFTSLSTSCFSNHLVVPYLSSAAGAQSFEFVSVANQVQVKIPPTFTTFAPTLSPTTPLFGKTAASQFMSGLQGSTFIIVGLVAGIALLAALGFCLYLQYDAVVRRLRTQELNRLLQSPSTKLSPLRSPKSPNSSIRDDVTSGSENHQETMEQRLQDLRTSLTDLHDLNRLLRLELSLPSRVLPAKVQKILQSSTVHELNSSELSYLERVDTEIRQENTRLVKWLEDKKQAGAGTGVINPDLDTHGFTSSQTPLNSELDYGDIFLQETNEFEANIEGWTTKQGPVSDGSGKRGSKFPSSGPAASLDIASVHTELDSYDAIYSNTSLVSATTNEMIKGPTSLSRWSSKGITSTSTNAHSLSPSGSVRHLTNRQPDDADIIDITDTSIQMGSQLPVSTLKPNGSLDMSTRAAHAQTTAGVKATAVPIISTGPQSQSPSQSPDDATRERSALIPIDDSTEHRRLPVKLTSSTGESGSSNSTTFRHIDSGDSTEYYMSSPGASQPFLDESYGEMGSLSSNEPVVGLVRAKVKRWSDVSGAGGDSGGSKSKGQKKGQKKSTKSTRDVHDRSPLGEERV